MARRRSRRLKRAIIYVDGSVINNGQARQRRRYAGAGVFFGDGHHLNRAIALYHIQDINEAEILAAVEGIKMAKRNGISCMEIRTDNQVVYDAADDIIHTGRYDSICFRDKINTLWQVMQGVDVIFTKVRSGDDYGNIQADSLARQGAERNRIGDVEVYFDQALNELSTVLKNLIIARGDY